jgi:hypothetical protein
VWLLIVDQGCPNDHVYDYLESPARAIQPFLAGKIGRPRTAITTWSSAASKPSKWAVAWTVESSNRRFEQPLRRGWRWLLQRAFYWPVARIRAWFQVSSI